MSEADYRFLEEKGLSPSSAASMLGISRQAVYAGLTRLPDYFDGKRKADLLSAIELKLHAIHPSSDTGAVSPEAGLCTISFGRSIDALLGQEIFRSFVGGGAAKWHVFCAILADGEAANTVANVVQSAIHTASPRAQVAPRAMVFKSNIARVAPAMALQLDADGVWQVKSQSAYGSQDAFAYCNALVLTLSACGLTFRTSTRSLHFDSICPARTDGLYLELLLDSEPPTEIPHDQP